jgi:hypothetical protein
MDEFALEMRVPERNWHWIRLMLPSKELPVILRHAQTLLKQFRVVCPQYEIAVSVVANRRRTLAVYQGTHTDACVDYLTQVALRKYSDVRATESLPG